MSIHVEPTEQVAAVLHGEIMRVIESRDLTYADLGEATGFYFDRGRMHRMRKNKTGWSIDTYVVVAEALGIQTTWTIEREGFAQDCTSIDALKRGLHAEILRHIPARCLSSDLARFEELTGLRFSTGSMYKLREFIIRWGLNSFIAVARAMGTETSWRITSGHPTPKIDAAIRRRRMAEATALADANAAIMGALALPC